ncbi:MAG: DMT family transporter [Thermomicrobiales bacterium]
MISREGWGVAGAIAAPTILGSSVAVTKVLTDYPHYTGQTLRYGFAAIVLAIVLKARSMNFPRPDLRSLGLLVLVALTGLAGFNILMLLALREAEPAAVGVVVGCVPIVLATLGPLLSRQTPSRRVLTASVIVVAGAAIAQGGGATTLKGFLLSLGILVCEAGFSLLAVPVLPKVGPHAISLYVCIIATVILGSAALIADGTGSFSRPSGSEAAAIAYLAVAVTCGAFIFWYEGISRLGVDRAGLFAGVIPMSALLSAVVIGEGSLGTYQVLGVLLVAAGVTFGVMGPSTAHKRAEEDMPSSAPNPELVPSEARQVS